MGQQRLSLFASCPKGLESLLEQELHSFDLEVTGQTVAGVYFSADLKGAYRACLWSRLANRVVLQLGEFAAENGDDIYACVVDLLWEEHLSPAGSLAVDFSGTNREIRNTQFGALRVKDAIVDRLRDRTESRPSVAKQNPDVRVIARLNRGKLSVGIDLSGESLHRRGYRLKGGAAPLKENLAAGILLRSGWPELAAAGGSLLDPMCGSGTFLIEAGMIAADIAPGLMRPAFGFETWLNHRNDIWLDLRQEALQRRTEGLSKPLPEIRGYDQDPRIIRIASENIAHAGLDDCVRVSAKTLAEFKLPTHKNLKPGLVITNPPYGERLGKNSELAALYRQLGERLKADFCGWRCGIFTGNPELGKTMGVRASKRYKLFNGPIASELLLLDIEQKSFVDTDRAPMEKGAAQGPLSEGTKMLVNRLLKNQKQLAKWVKQNAIQCYRLYDADMPEYSAAIDIYGEYVHVQEYAPPAKVDPDKAAARFKEIQAAVPEALGVEAEKVVYKQRRRQKGKAQYERAEKTRHKPIQVQEGQAKLWVNLWDYLDTGLFLDHRPVRRFIAEQSRGKRFLNLFSYTATSTVHAALGGARSSLSVDMSNTYRNWARDNFTLNNLDLSVHHTLQADCMQWLEDTKGEFDLIFLDPPTFSNSKKMENVFDVQRDHTYLIEKAMELLAKDGLLIFSCNLRSFKLDEKLQESFSIRDVTATTLDKDFQRNQKIHRCWHISHQ